MWRLGAFGFGVQGGTGTDVCDDLTTIFLTQDCFQAISADMYLEVILFQTGKYQHAKFFTKLGTLCDFYSQKLVFVRLRDGKCALGL